MIDGEEARMDAYHVKMYWAWLFLRLTSAALPMGAPLASMSRICDQSGSAGHKLA